MKVKILIIDEKGNQWGGEVILSPIKKFKSDQRKIENKEIEFKIFQVGLKKLVEEIQVEESRLSKIYSVTSKGKLKIVAPLRTSKAEGKSQLQKRIAYLYLLGSKKILDKEVISQKDLGAQIRAYGALDGNLARNLETEDGYIVLLKDKGKKKKGFCKLTPDGEKRALEILKKITEKT
jgi:hypothetical protein